MQACSGTPEKTLADEVARDYPNTKIIPYPLLIADEQDTLGLIDDILNSWGRLGSPSSTT